MLSDVEAIWEQINRDYQHQRFAPGKLASLRQRLEIAKSNISAGVSEAAIATSQQAYLDLVDLRFELEQKEQEWLLLYNATLTDIRSLIAEVQANRECEIQVGQAEETKAPEYDEEKQKVANLNQTMVRIQDNMQKYLDAMKGSPSPTLPLSHPLFSHSSPIPSPSLFSLVV